MLILIKCIEINCRQNWLHQKSWRYLLSFFFLDFNCYRIYFKIQNVLQILLKFCSIFHRLWRFPRLHNTLNNVFFFCLFIRQQLKLYIQSGKRSLKVHKENMTLTDPWLKMEILWRSAKESYVSNNFFMTITSVCQKLTWKKQLKGT